MPPKSVTSAVSADLQRVPAEIRESALAQVALRLAANLDEGAGLSTAAVARELRATLGELLRFAKAEVSTVDDLAKRRTARRSAASKRADGSDVSGSGGG